MLFRSRQIFLDGRQYTDPKTVIYTYNGESIGHFEKDTLVVDTVAIDTRMRNISVGRSGDANAWTHSDQEHVIERFSRRCSNIAAMSNRCNARRSRTHRGGSGAGSLGASHIPFRG